MLIAVVLTLFFFIYVDADRSSTYEEGKLRMKVKGVYMPDEKINIIGDKDKDYYIQEEEYFYEKEEPFNFTCEAVNFKTNTIISLKFREITMLSGKYLFLPLEASIDNKSITVTYKPSTEKSIICTTEVNSESKRKKEHTYVIKFNKKPSNETSKPNQVETKSNIKVIFLYIVIIFAIVTIVIMLIILIKMRRKQKKSQNEMRFDLIEGTNRNIENDNQYEDQENKATTASETSPQQLKYAKLIATYVNSKNSNNTDEKNHWHSYVNVNTQQNGSEYLDQDEWTSNSAYETLSHLYCEINN